MSPPKTEKFQIKNSDIFHISAQNIDRGHSLEPPRRGGSNEYPHSMFSSKNKTIYVYPCKPQFYYIKVGFKGVKIICFRNAKQIEKKIVIFKNNINLNVVFSGEFAELNKICCKTRLSTDRLQ